MPNHPPASQQLTPDREQKIRRNYANSEADATVPLLLGEIDRLRKRHKTTLRRADQINNELMEEVQRYAEGAERPVLWSVYNAMHLRAARADAALDRVREVVRRLAAHAVGFQDVLDEGDRGAWGKTVGADIAELTAAVAAPEPAAT